MFQEVYDAARLRAINLLFRYSFSLYDLFITKDIFAYNDYRDYLQERVETDPHRWGLWAKLAKAAGCQATYLSQVIKGKAHLTPDHVLGLASYLRLNEEEIDHFLLMLELARAGTPTLRKFISAKLSRKKKERENIAKRVSLPRLDSTERETFYYSAWYWAALHVIVSIPEYRTTSAIAQRLMLSKDFVESALHQLEALGFVKREGREWRLGIASLHLPKNSPMITLHHGHWRQRAILDAAMMSNDGVHYTAIHSIALKDYQAVKEKILELIEECQKIVSPSKDEELVCMTCDLFKV